MPMEDERYSKEWFVSVLDALPELVLVKGDRSRLLWANRAFREYYGLSNEELREQVDSAHSDPDDTVQYVRDDHEVFTTGRTVDVVEPITRHDGVVAYYCTTKVPLRSRNTNAIVGTVGTSRPVADAIDTATSENARSERKSTLDMLRGLATGLPIIAAVVDAKLRLVATTARFCEAFGVGDSAKGVELEAAVAVPDVLAQALARAVDAGKAALLPDLPFAGTERRYDVSVSPWVLPTDQTGGALLVWTDVTQLRAVERALVSANQELGRLVHSLSTGAIVAHRDGTLAVLNRRAEQMLGVPREELPALGWIEHLGLLDPDGEPLTRSNHPLHRAWNGEGCRDELARVRVSQPASDRWLSVSAAPLPESSSYRAVMSLTDVTAHIRTQRELEEFAYVASHDLREPLRMVTSYLSLVRESLEDRLDEETREYMQFATDAADRMAMLIRNLLDFSRSGAAALTLEPVPLDDMMSEIEHDLGELLEPAGARLIYESLPVLRADRGQLKQLLANLVSNAVKFRDPDRLPEIRVTARDEGRAVRVEVADNGIGFDIKYAPKAFKMFQRLHSGRTYDGTGIGLAICKRVVERHGGALGVESQVGVGSRFWFTLGMEGSDDDGSTS